ncbi:hypothetical protein ACP70R_045646 [Stipagrostis hirtigluma subsp. patula]
MDHSPRLDLPLFHPGRYTSLCPAWTGSARDRCPDGLPLAEVAIAEQRAGRFRACVIQPKKMQRELPDDVLADVLRRAAPRALAACSCVCRSWRALIHDRGLLLPRSLAGFFVKYFDLPLTVLFACPSTEPTRYRSCHHILDHCNGLVLRRDYVSNPATRRWAPLPKHPPPRSGMPHYRQDMYLVFDPAVSSHYEVFLVPRVPTRYDSDDEVDPEQLPHCEHSMIPDLKVLPFYNHRTVDVVDRATLESEWPPSSFILNVFSSRMGRWEKRSYARDGEPAGTIADMELGEQWAQRRHAVYWQGSLYVHCECDFAIRVSLSSNKYRVIKPPQGIEMCQCPELHLGRSEKGVYYALFDGHLRIWILDESQDRIEWKLKHYSSGYSLMLRSQNSFRGICKPWILQNARGRREDDDEAPVDQKVERVPDDDKVECCFGDDYRILGFHPYKEVLFLHNSSLTGLAYHINGSKLEELGSIHPGYLGDLNRGIEASYPYTPCWIGEFPETLKSEERNK